MDLALFSTRSFSVFLFTILLTLKTIQKKYWELLRDGATGQKFTFEIRKLFQNGSQKKIFLSSFV